MNNKLIALLIITLFIACSSPLLAMLESEETLVRRRVPNAAAIVRVTDVDGNVSYVVSHTVRRRLESPTVWDYIEGSGHTVLHTILGLTWCKLGVIVYRGGVFFEQPMPFMGYLVLGIGATQLFEAWEGP